MTRNDNLVIPTCRTCHYHLNGLLQLFRKSSLHMKCIYANRFSRKLLEKHKIIYSVLSWSFVAIFYMEEYTSSVIINSQNVTWSSFKLCHKCDLKQKFQLLYSHSDKQNVSHHCIYRNPENLIKVHLGCRQSIR
jgi:hypothetical protein